MIHSKSLLIAILSLSISLFIGSWWYMPQQQSSPRTFLLRTWMRYTWTECSRHCFTAKHDRIYTKHDFLTEGAHYLWPFHRPHVHQTAHWVPVSWGPKGQRQVQSSSLLSFQGTSIFKTIIMVEEIKIQFGHGRLERESIKLRFNWLFIMTIFLNIMTIRFFFLQDCIYFIKNTRKN